MAYNAGTAATLAELITAKFIPEKFTKDVITTAKENLVCANLFNNTYRNDLKFGYKISIPVMSGASATEVTPGTAPTAQDLKGTAASVTVDKWYESSAEISDLMEVEELADWLRACGDECAHAILKEVDSDIGSDFSALGGSSVEGAQNQAFTDAIFRALVEALDENDVPDSPRFLIGDPSMKRDMLDIEKFISTDYTKQTVPTGMFGQLYGATVHVTNNLTAVGTSHYGVYAHRDAIGVVIQMNPRSQVIPVPREFITLIQVDCAWGANEIRDTFGKAFYTRKS